MSSCFLIGHRDADLHVYSALMSVIYKFISEYRVDEFIVGRYGRFDRMVARAVDAAKVQYPHIRLTLLLPYLTERPLPEPFDGSMYPDGLEYVPKRFAILQANYRTIDRCDYVIVYVYRTYGGAYRCMEYARKKTKKIINIAE